MGIFRHLLIIVQPQVLRAASCLSVLLLACPLLAAEQSTTVAQPPLPAFGAASAAYKNGDYAQAVSEFSRIAAATPSAAAYYNLGNAYYRNGQPGLAVHAYERANTYAYGQPGILANLAKAREAARLEEPPLSLWQRYARGLGPNQWTLLLAIGFWCSLGLWLVPPLYRKRHGIWRPALLTLAIAVTLLAAGGLYPWLHWRKAGTVLAKDTPLLLAPTTTSPVQAYAQPGQTAYRIRSHGNFDNIRLENGNSGWVARDHFAQTWEH